MCWRWYADKGLYPTRCTDWYHFSNEIMLGFVLELVITVCVNRGSSESIWKLLKIVGVDVWEPLFDMIKPKVVAVEFE